MPTDVFPIESAQLVSMFMTNIFYGQSLEKNSISATDTPVEIVGGSFKPLGTVNFKMFVPAIFMFMLATVDVALGLQHNIEGFVLFQGGPIDVFANASDWVNLVKMADYVAQTFIGDGILLYRCWIVYDKSWLIILFPLMIWLGGTACGIVTVYVEATLREDPRYLNAPNLSPFITSMLALTLAMNLITTSLIIFRIWSIQRAVKFQTAPLVIKRRPLDKIMRILIESGFIYTVTIVILVGLYIACNNGQFGVSNSGITFNLIITRVDRRADDTRPTSYSFHLTYENNNLPLHTIHIQTNISRLQDPPVAPITAASGVKRSEWN
ncbi:hypothetical protein C0991_007000 [Blastosporella zonata]|nr:hypothetical protein C0991_007000 [Blastosporella zonata]